MLSSPIQPLPAVSAAVATAPVEPTVIPSLLEQALLSPTTQAPKTVVLVDPLSTGVALQKRLFEQGYQIILVWSDRTPAAAREKHCKNGGDFAAVILYKNNLTETIQEILKVTSDIHALMCGSEYGVVLEDNLAKGLNATLGTTHLRSSGMRNVQTKVDKHSQSSLLQEAGLNAVRETLAHSEEEVRAFLAQWSPVDSDDEFAPVVVKPQTGAGSVGVMFCDSAEKVLEAYCKIVQGEHKASYKNKYQHYSEAGVLLQEYLVGTEYIVNTVVLDGVPKTTAMFKYDKRPYNGAPFVCFSKELIVLADNPEYLEIVVYAERVMNAFGFHNGAVHAEVMYTSRGPVLVEMNCRLHGGNAQWVKPAEVCMGYSQLGVMMDAYLNGGNGEYSLVPSRPETAMQYCQQVKMRTHIEGILDCVLPEQFARIEALPSYDSHFFSVFPGDKLSKTIDMPTVPGEVTLIHPNPKVLEEDYHVLNTILAEGIFAVR